MYVDIALPLVEWLGWGETGREGRRKDGGTRVRAEIAWQFISALLWFWAAFWCSFPLASSPFLNPYLRNIVVFKYSICGGCSGEACVQTGYQQISVLHEYSICVWHLSSICPSRLGGPCDFGNLIMDLFWIKERMVRVCGGSRCWNSLSTFFKYESQTQVLWVLTHLYPTLLPPPVLYS